ncbi:hypothetical protein GCM10010112_93760 [Actinoplanes lobatus]|uniref:Ricin B lectin domain-containing protein n=1 Tax=Actinoplanes lobatus TaxID=113568 RepID=A0A7W7HKQ6_9ACTN|nr:RICIN domain-containing protein [Actinoplanes lobatus]MBB4752333.1 hypothetical protein [Actinoplanes lobatus]GGN99726.1 hypothetical protein GCM10010112_93760 [Actinoplanes lobatus]GIE46422.1 hypothetical protein Alo02nite_93200 [Actinoplanes lobatus]
MIDTEVPRRRAAAGITLVIMALIGALAGMASPANAAYNPMYLQSAYNDYYCTDYNPSGGVPVLGECDYSHEWLFVPANPSLNSYYLVARYGSDNMCLEQPDRNSDHLVVSLCRGATSQRWQIVYIGPGNAYRSYNGTGPCLDAPFGGSNIIAARTCHYRTNQQWYNF